MGLVAIRRRRAQRDRQRAASNGNLDVTIPPSSTETQRCSQCARRFTSEHVFCPIDGSPLSAWDSVAPPSVCPTCFRAYPNGTRHCPHDAEELMPQGYLKAHLRPTSQAPLPGDKVCPNCDHHYPPSATYCQGDGTKLLSMN
ncbi:MAG: hypothetical protein R3A47_04170 [Polyangiales bacterium]